MRTNKGASPICSPGAFDSGARRNPRKDIPMTFITDAGPGSETLKADRLAENEPAQSDVQRIIRDKLPPLPSESVRTEAVCEALGAFEAAEIEAVQAIDNLGITRAAMRRAAIADATALQEAAKAGSDMNEVVHDAHARVALSEHARAVAIARARLGVLAQSAQAVRRAAREDAREMEQAARSRLEELATRHDAALDAFFASRGAYAAAAADTATSIAWRAEIEHRSAGSTTELAVQEAVASAWKPSTDQHMRVGNRRIDMGDALAAIREDARRHVQPPAKTPTGDDQSLQDWVTSRMSNGDHAAVWR